MREIMLMTHFIGLAMGLGTSFAHLFFSKTLLKLSIDEEAKFQNQIKGLSLMGGIGTLLLLVSGVYLIIPFWPAIGYMPLLITKLILFLFLVVLILLMNSITKRRLKNKTQGSSNVVKIMGKMAFMMGVIIVVIAVMVFH